MYRVGTTFVHEIDLFSFSSSYMVFCICLYPTYITILVIHLQKFEIKLVQITFIIIYIKLNALKIDYYIIQPLFLGEQRRLYHQVLFEYKHHLRLKVDTFHEYSDHVEKIIHLLEGGGRGGGYELNREPIII